MPLDGSAEDEIRRFEEQYERQPESLVFARLADAYRKAGEPGRALELLAEGIARHPDYLSAHIVLARTFRDLGREGDAREAFERVLELDAQNLVAMRGLAELARRGGDSEGERRWLRRLVQADPFNEEPAARLAELDAPDEVSAAEVGEVEPAPPGGQEPEETVPGPTPGEGTPDAGREHPEAEEEHPGAEEEPPDAGRERLPEPWWFEAPVPEPAEGDVEEDADLLTRTMAELYARQGLLDEAEEIYRELLRDRPGDAELRAGLDTVLGMRAARSATRGTASGALEEEVHASAPGESKHVIESTSPGIAEELRDLLEAGRFLGPRLPVPPEQEPAPVPSPAGPAAETEGGEAETSPSVLEDWLRRLRR